MKNIFKTQPGRFVAALIALVLIAVLTAGAGKLPFLKADVTPQQVMTMDQKAVDTVKALEQDVEIYYLANENGKDLWVYELVQKYDRMSDHITLRMIDPAGDKASELAGMAGGALAENSLVVVSGDRSIAIAADSLYNVVYNEMYYYYYGEMVVQEQSFAADQKLVNALLYVTRDDLPVVYALTGHGETAAGGMMLSHFQESNVLVKPLKLDAAVPGDAAAVMICAPTSDLTASEADALLAYLRQGGNLILLTGYTMESRPNLDRVTSYYGMKAENGIVLEMTTGYCYSAEYPQYLTPDVLEHEVTKTLAGSGVKTVVQLAGAIKPSGIGRSGLKVTELMTTSDTAYMKTNAMMASIAQEETDLPGKYTVAMAAEDGDTKITWFMSGAFLSDTDIQVSSGANLYVLDGTIRWMMDVIPQEEIVDENLLAASMNVTSSNLALVCCLMFVPVLIVLIAGLVCGRRKKS